MPKVCVIGAGFGGLALAVRLQSAGIETVLLEARDKPGGRAYVHEAEGFVFDAGPTVVTDPACLAELFQLTGRDIADYVELMPVSPFYRLLWEDGTQFDYSNDEAALFAQIEALSPADVEGYRKFLKFSEGVWREGYVKLGHTAFLDFKQMLAAAPSLARYQAWRSVYSMVASHIRHPKLREAFSFHTLLVGGDPYKTSSVYALIHKLEKDGGVWFPRGGTHALVRGLLKLFTDLGGEVRMNAKVARIEAEGARVTEVVTEDGWRGRFDAVASNGDVVDTYARMLGHTPRGAAKGRSLKRARFSPSLFVVYFGVRREYPDVKHHSILFGPRYKGLLSDIYDKGVLAEDFSLYLHHPTATDPAMAPPGCSTFYVLSPVPHLGKAPIDWDVEGPKYRDRILDKLERWVLPGLRESLAHVSELTPLGFQRNLSAHLGSAFSLEPILTQSAWFRVHNRDDVLRNLYFVGAGTHPGAGIPGVVGSAKATARVLLSDFGLEQTAPTQMRMAAE